MFNLAVAQGDSASLANLAFCYQTGTGVKKNLLQAADKYCLSFMKGNDFAAYFIARCYQSKKLPFGQDIRECVRWLRLALQHDCIQAQPALNRIIKPSVIK